MTYWIGVLLGSGGLWLTVREIARQMGETKRAQIKSDEAITKLAIARTIPPPDKVSGDVVDPPDRWRRSSRS